MDVHDDPVVSVLPIHYTTALAPAVHLHQFPLLTRPLQAPPSAAASGKRIRARIKPAARRLELRVPADARPDVWNAERSRALGAARAQDDRERNQQDAGAGRQREGEEPRLAEVRMRSEQIPQRCAYMLGVVRDGQLYLHPIQETHQFRPALTYLDILSRKNRHGRSAGDSGSDSDDGPPPDPDDPVPVPAAAPKKEKKPSADAKEVQVQMRRTDEKAGMQTPLGGLSAARREILQILRKEDEETWEDLEFCDGESISANESFASFFSPSIEKLECTTEATAFLTSINGL